MKEINQKIGVLLTRAVGSMWAAYLFAIIALLGLPAALRPGGQGLVAWIAQTFLQLVLLSVIMVGQEVQSKAGEAREKETHDAVMEQLALNYAQQQALTKILSSLAKVSDAVEG